MKGFVAISNHSPAKRRWRASAAVVLVLVVFSLLVPLDFLLGLHNRFPSGYLTDDRQTPERSFRNLGHLDGVSSFPQGVDPRIEKLVKKFGPSFSKDVTGNHMSNTGELLNEKPVINVGGKGTGSNSQNMNPTTSSEPKHTAALHKLEISNPHPKVLPTPQILPSESVPGFSSKLHSRDIKNSNTDGGNGEDIRKSCQFKFGSYCLWSIEHKEVMEDSTIKKLKDQLFVARAYYPSIAKLHGQQKLTRDLKQNIQEHERMLSDAIVNADLPSFVEKNIHKMEQTTAKAKACTVDCNNVEKKLRQILDLTEDEANFHMKQSAFLYHLGVQTMPKSLHCLSMRLTVEYFKAQSAYSKNSSHSNKLDSPNLMHYVIFSKNILAAAVTINSTAMNFEVNQNMVFHVVTDTQHYYAMKLWFGRNSYRGTTISVINFEKLKMNGIHNTSLAKLSLSEEFRVSVQKTDQPAAQMSTEYITVFGHSHFLLPEIFKNLKKVVVLDDDVVVQHDLSSLWNLNLEGKVNGAVEFCRLRVGQLKLFLGSNSYDANSCAWMTGINVIDLEKWREHNLTGAYLQLLKSFQTKNESSFRAAALPASLLVFKNLIYPLGEKWSLSGLGHNYGVSADAINSSISLHYDGNMKPWLDLGIPKYKKYWKKFLTRNERFMDECNVNA
ncbi:putative galacturonosyltransferase 7 isoform X1 [Canna indica]|uniref:Hexosyltransferase n=1 Tax=Canna indica TaxID=4628 RepID=A0AAQ3KZJ1_9LILI|nr:putative galacturonosyltransferase 7 isoform X1 [Canna indica]